MDHPSDTPPQTVTPEHQADSAPSSRLTRRHLLMGCAMLGVSGLAFARAPKRRFDAMSDKQYEALFPRSFGDWHLVPTSELIMPPESELANKLYEHILTRSYENSAGQVVMFLAAFSSLQVEDVQLHRPEVCYRVSGFQIEQNEPFDLKISDQTTVPSRMILATRPLRRETILYWTRVGNDFPGGWSDQRWAMAKANLAGYYPDGILVRASVADAGDESVAILEKFYRDLDRHTGAPTKRVLYNA